MKKNKIIIIVAVVVVIIGGLVGWGLLQAKKLKTDIAQVVEKPPEVLFLSGTVSSVDLENNFLMVIPEKGTEDIKVIVSETTKMTKQEFPFDPANPPEEGTFTPKETEIGISGFKAGDKVFIRSKEDIFGKKEIGNIDFIQM